MTLLTEKQVVKLLAAECNKAGGIGQWARSHRITPSYVYSIFNNKCGVGKAVAKALNLKKIAMFEGTKNSATKRL